MNSPKLTSTQIAALTKLGPEYAQMFRHPVQGKQQGLKPLIATQHEKDMPTESTEANEYKVSKAFSSRWPTTRQAGIISLLVGFIGLLNTSLTGHSNPTVLFRIFNGSVSFIGIAYTQFLTCVIVFFAVCWWRECRSAGSRK